VSRKRIQKYTKSVGWDVPGSLPTQAAVAAQHCTKKPNSLGRTIQFSFTAISLLLQHCAFSETEKFQFSL
jgi:hypothetical protein